MYYFFYIYYLLYESLSVVNTVDSSTVFYLVYQILFLIILTGMGTHK